MADPTRLVRIAVGAVALYAGTALAVALGYPLLGGAVALAGATVLVVAVADRRPLAALLGEEG